MTPRGSRSLDSSAHAFFLTALINQDWILSGARGADEAAGLIAIWDRIRRRLIHSQPGSSAERHLCQRFANRAKDCRRLSEWFQSYEPVQILLPRLRATFLGRFRVLRLADDLPRLSEPVHSAHAWHCRAASLRVAACQVAAHHHFTSGEDSGCTAPARTSDRRPGEVLGSGACLAHLLRWKFHSHPVRVHSWDYLWTHGPETAGPEPPAAWPRSGQGGFDSRLCRACGIHRCGAGFPGTPPILTGFAAEDYAGWPSF